MVIESSPAGPRVRISGEWTLAHYRALYALLATQPLDRPPSAVDLSTLRALDTAGASLLVRLLGQDHVAEIARTAPELSAERRRLLATVATASARANAEPLQRPPTVSWTRHLAALGLRVEDGGRQIVLALGFMGQVLAVVAAGLLQPRRWRLAALSRQLQHTALEAIPIVALLASAVGAVVALLGITVLGRFGAGVYAVDLVSYAFMRELGVLLTAILLAGRSASAFTAQIGSMKANEELDAMHAQGLSPIEMLVVPRVLALMVALPVLTFVAVMCGLGGGAAVAVFSLDLSLLRVLDLIAQVPLEHYVVGMIKAPFFAFVIGVIGCLEGLKCQSSAQSVGSHTTSAVVQAIFWVIILNAAAAVFFVEIGW
ncbi:ABC transporter permease [Halorhodospira abdelmalekii]|nr:ABC transporter permease [Halorhodospira abdelmalekii]MBK1735372.1 ABC transporter permease [Halorhodospira abdelmalekii]